MDDTRRGMVMVADGGVVDDYHRCSLKVELGDL